MKQILLAYGPHQETIAAIRMLYKNTKVKVHSLDGDTNFFDSVTGVLLRRYVSPIPVHNQPRLHTSNIDRFNVRKWVYCDKGKKQTVTDADYTDDIALLANTSALAKSLLHSLEKAAGDKGLRVDADKMEYMCLNQNQKGDIYDKV